MRLTKNVRIVGGLLGLVAAGCSVDRQVDVVVDKRAGKCEPARDPLQGDNGDLMMRLTWYAEGASQPEPLLGRRTRAQQGSGSLSMPELAGCGAACTLVLQAGYTNKSATDGMNVISRGQVRVPGVHDTVGPIISDVPAIAARMPLRRVNLFTPLAGPEAEEACMALLSDAREQAAKQVRYGHAVAALPSGELLVVGGVVRESGQEAFVSSIVRVDPVSGRISDWATLTTARAFHTASIIQGPNGESLLVVVGGRGASQGAIPDAELFRIAADGGLQGKGTVSPLEGGGRTGHAAVVVAGNLLLLGGSDGGGQPVDTTAVFKAGTQQWSSGPSLAVARAEPGAVALPGNRVLVAGGWDGAGRQGTTELLTLDADGTFSRDDGWSAALPDGATLPVGPSLAASADGRVVLIAGGTPGRTEASVAAFNGTDVGGAPLASRVWVLDTNDAGGEPAFGVIEERQLLTRWGSTLTPLRDGSFLLAGGWSGTSSPVASDAADLLVPGASAPASLTVKRLSKALMVARIRATYSLLPDGTVLAIGGRGTNQGDEIRRRRLELFQPDYVLTEASIYGGL